MLKIGGGKKRKRRRRDRESGGGGLADQGHAGGSGALGCRWPRRREREGVNGKKINKSEREIDEMERKEMIERKVKEREVIG